MNCVAKTLILLLAGLALSACGGGGGDGHGAFEPPGSGSITLTATTTTLPLNVTNSTWFTTSPFSSEVDINWRNADGTPVSGHDLSCSISPLEVASIHILDDASTDDDESAVDWGNIQVHSDTGHAVCWVFARGHAGTARLTVGGVDPITGASLSSSLDFTVQNASGPLPASVTVVPQPSGVYIPGSGGIQSSVLTIAVFDGGNQPVPDPLDGNAGADNVLLEIVGDAGGARLSANSVTGPVSGASVATHTVHGVANASFQSGTLQGPIQIRVTVDRADNNVTNGVGDALSTTTSVIVSDGKLFSLVITSPALDSLQVNPPASGDVTLAPDGTYSLTVSALATDQQGSPVAVGTPIAFGAIDAPLVGFPDQGSGSFAISGNDGNPQEGGTLFTAPGGRFTTAGGGAGPGDTLLVLGNQVTGNSDLESARVVRNVNSATGLDVFRAFNSNDNGNQVDYGPVLPYVIGRATEVNITASAQTNAAGVATVQMTYPVTRLGKAVYIWAQADGGATGDDSTRIVSAISGYGFAGEAPATLSASPSPIAGNTTSFVTVCLSDARSEALQGAFIAFSFEGVAGQAILDGQAGSGVFASPTDGGGCVTGSITTTGIAAAGVASVQFSAGPGLSIDVPISPVGNGLLLQVSPSALAPAGGSVSIVVSGSDGSPQAGVGVGVTCSGGVSSTIPGATDASGHSSATISNPGLDAGTGGSCVYTAGGDGGPTATVTVSAPEDSGGTPPGPQTLTLMLVPPAGGTGPYTVSSAPAGVSCSASTTTQTCTGPFDQGTAVTLSANVAPVSWTGSCIVSGTDPKIATVTMSSAESCAAHF